MCERDLDGPAVPSLTAEKNVIAMFRCEAKAGADEADVEVATKVIMKHLGKAALDITKQLLLVG